MPGLISEERFVELIEQIPVLSEKIDRILSVLDTIAENGSTIGMDRSPEGDPFELDPNRMQQERAVLEEIRRKKEESAKLRREADELERQLDL